MARPKNKVEFGDFQTPPRLAQEALQALFEEARTDGGSPRPATLVEPTCGEGAFLLAAGQIFSEARLLGWDINGRYCAAARSRLEERSIPAQVQRADCFRTDWERLAGRWDEPIWVIGNPPWVTSAGVARVGGANRPKRQAQARISGYDAMTGKSNFDVSEWMLLTLLEALRGKDFRVGMLLKSQVARRLIETCEARGMFLRGSLRPINAASHFSASVDAVFFHARPAPGPGAGFDVYASLGGDLPVRKLGVLGGRVCADLERRVRTEKWERKKKSGDEMRWRSGMKHDLSRIMELSVEGLRFKNGEGEELELEGDLLFPLLKGSDVAHDRPPGRRMVIVPQKKIGAPTDSIQRLFPLTGSYLSRHEALFTARKSAIYRGQPPYAVFGIGDYSFAPYKVAICGLYRRLAFSLVGPHEGKPVFFDDTVYFLPFSDAATARATHAVLTSREATDFFEARVFWDAKRPINKALLESLDVERLLRAAMSEVGEDAPFEGAFPVDHFTKTSQGKLM